jgi:hypothetical protein
LLRNRGTFLTLEKATSMAKGQKKSNKETRKPKADKSKATTATSLFSKGSTSADMLPKGKG